jgi:hypothetical protein
MMNDKATNCNVTKRIRDNPKKMNLTLLSSHRNDLNFKENIGISETNKHEKNTTNSITTAGWNKIGWINPRCGSR